VTAQHGGFTVAAARGAASYELDAATDSTRRFTRRAVRRMARAGIWQYVDLGSGTSSVVPEAAWSVSRGAQVVCVDSDPLVCEQNQALLTGQYSGAAVCGDIRDPHGLLASLDTARLLDSTKRVGVVCTGVLHLLAHFEMPRQAMAAFMAVTSAGSWLAISHFTSDGTPQEMITALQSAAPPAVCRSMAEISAMFGDLELLGAGVTDICGQWGNNQWRAHPPALRVAAGIGRKRRD
jgi:hypothetical protein